MLRTLPVCALLLLPTAELAGVARAIFLRRQPHQPQQLVHACALRLELSLHSKIPILLLALLPVFLFRIDLYRLCREELGGNSWVTEEQCFGLVHVAASARQRPPDQIPMRAGAILISESGRPGNETAGPLVWINCVSRWLCETRRLPSSDSRLPA